MGDWAVVVEGVDSELSRRTLRSTVHGAGRVQPQIGAGDSLTTEVRAASSGAFRFPNPRLTPIFRLTLPAHVVAQSLPPRASNSGDAPTRVLVVDDEEPIRRLLGRLLARRGYEVAEAKTVDEAFSLV